MGNQFLTLCPTDFYEGGEFETTYEVDETNCIGVGKFATVHLCWKRNDPDKRYALKVINTKMGDHSSLDRIRDEISILQVLGSHRGMVSLVDVDESMAGTIRLILEYCEGGELYDRIQQLTHYSESEAKVCTRSLMNTLAFIHAKGVMHRDLKPENILLISKESNVDVKISDLGLAKMSRDFPRKLPRSHSICGSDFYLAPEVIKQEEYGREIDIWAVGVIAYVLLSGSLPFFHDVLHKLYRQIVERDLSFSGAAWKNVSKGALDFILRLLQVRAGDRLTADQGLQHPWLRAQPAAPVGSSAASFNSFNSQVSRSPSDYALGDPRMVHPLEHAHKVNNAGQGYTPGPPTGQPFNANYAPQPYVGAPQGAVQYGGAPQGMYGRLR